MQTNLVEQKHRCAIDTGEWRTLSVVFVDVAGFSTLMSEDEASTYAKLYALRSDILLPELARHDGVFYKSTGDGILATFDDVIKAVRWSQQVQMKARAARHGLTLRISVNHCDVIIDQTDLVGDGVNIAARLQEKSAPGGVIMTETVHQLIQHAPEFETRELGLLMLKNISRPVRAFDLVTDGRLSPRQLREDAGKEDFPETDLFQVQDSIVERVITRIAPHVHAAERGRILRKRPENFTAYEYALRALDLIGSLDPPEFYRANDYLRRAMELDPNFAMPVAWAARWRTLRVGQGWSDDLDADTQAAADLAARAINLDRRNALALATFGHVQSYLFGEFEVALDYLNRARDASPNSAIAWSLSSATLSYLGRGEEAVRYAEKGLRLSPFDQNLFYFYNFLAFAHYACDRFEEACKWCRRALVENPRYTSPLKILAASLAALGRLEEARGVGARVLTLEPGFRISRYNAKRRLFDDPAKREATFEHLRCAGIPD